MYKIIGGDQKQYGPVTTDEVRAWIADGRLNAQTLAWAEGEPDWKPLGAFPEFADALRAKAAPTVGVPAVPPGMAPIFAAEILARPPRLQIGQCLSRSWVLVKQNFGVLFGTTFVVWAVTFVCGRIPWVAGIIGSLIGGMLELVVRGPVYGGMYLVFLKKIRGEE